MAPSRCLSLLPLAACCAAAGWFASRAIYESLLPAEPTRLRQATFLKSKAPDGPAVKPDTPEGKWMARARAAAAGDFAALFEELDALFPQSSRSGERQAAMQWLLGLWIARDADAAAAWAAERNDELTDGLFGMMLGRVAPEKAAEFLNGPVHDEFGWAFRPAVLRALAETDPRAFLKLEVSGEDQQYDQHWSRALQSLGRNDPAAAAAVWANSGRMGPTGQTALFSLVHDWMARDPQAVRGWMDSLKDTECRRLAQHAWLSALAGKDLAVARRELEKLDLGAWLPPQFDGGADHPQDARMAILAALAQENPAAAWAEMERLLETIKVAKSVEESSDPFANPGDHPAGPLRQAVLEVIAEGLPDDPAQLLAALRKQGADFPLDDNAQRFLAEVKVRDWNKQTVSQTIRMLLPDDQQYDPLGESIRDSLVTKLSETEPDMSITLFASLSEAKRREIAFDLVIGLRYAGTDSLLKLAPLLPEDRWSDMLAWRLAEVPEKAKGLIEKLPASSNTSDVFSNFAGTWGRRDPAAAAQWLLTLPGEGPHHAAQGLAAEWAIYDDAAASAWVASLPEGLTRDGAARGLVRGIASTDPEAAWQWAASMSKYQAAKAYGEVARWWGNKAPPEFVAALTAAMEHADGSDKAAALESLKNPPEERWINP